jgi:hypothetical protein
MIRRRRPTVHMWLQTTAIAVASLLVPIVASAASITVHNTGVDSSVSLVASGQQTAFWELRSAPAGATEAPGSNPFAFTHFAYASNTATSQWVAPANSGNASVAGVYTYALTVDLTGLDPATAVITGFFATDNEGAISVNGAPPAATLGFEAFDTLSPFTLSSGFVAGLNTIEVSVNNAGNPTAFHVQFTSAVADPATSNPIPEPGSLVLLGSGLFAAMARRRRLASGQKR